MHSRRTPVIKALLVAVALMAGTLTAVAPAHAAAPPHDGLFTLQNHRSGLCLSPNGPFANAGIGQVSCWPLDGYQQWKRDQHTDGYSWLRNQGTGFCMDLFANSPDEVRPRVLVQQFWCNLEWTSEDWDISPSASPGYSLLVTKVNHFCAEIENRSTSEGARLRLNWCNAFEPSQQFRLNPA
jgi:hypothetical protein